MKPANKVALNITIQYARVVITMGFSLYSIRLLLQALHAQDYGIFNLVAGVISLFAFMQAAMASSTQRFLSYSQGKKDISLQKKIFSNSVLLHLFIAILLVIILELAGIFLFNGFLNIPLNRVGAAKVVYHCMCASVFFSILSMPFTSLLVAHENILWIATVNTIEIFLKLAAVLLLFILQGDRIIIYGILVTLISLLILLAYIFYCKKKYEECVFVKFGKDDIPLVKQLTSFAGWNLFGSLCSTGRYEGLAILLNFFFGTIANAAFGIANQFAAQLSFFSVTILRSITPQIVKSEGNNDRKRMIRLSMMASKSGFFLLAIIAIPVIFEMPSILAFWLKDVPANTIIFCRLVLVGALINQVTIGLEAALQAIGDIKIYQSLVGSLLLANIPLAYVMLKYGYPAYIVLITYCFIESIACCVRFYLVQKSTGLTLQEYYMRVVGKEIIPMVVTCIIAFVITTYFQFNFRFLLTGAVCSIVCMLTIFVSGLCDDEKALVKQFFRRVFDWLRRYKSISVNT